MKKSLIAIAGLGLLCSIAYTLDNQKSQQLTGNKTQMQTSQEQNKSPGEAFLAANKNKPGVVTLADGLQYKIIVDGKGEKPTANDSVTVHYAGTLMDGT